MRVYILLSIIVLVCACKIGKRYQAPEMELPEKLTTIQENDSSTLADVEWYQLFDDTILVNYIQMALENNQDMKVAMARMKEMLERKRIAAAPLLPSVDLYANTDREEVEESNSVSKETDLRGELTWELDLWGNIRWGKEAAKAEYFSSIEGQRALKMSLIANVAQTYFELSAAYRELRIVKETGKARGYGVELTKARFEGGLSSETSLSQANVEYAQTMTIIPSVEKNVVIKENELAILLGQMPDTFELHNSIKDYKVPDSIPVGLPSYILERRPDVQMAANRLRVANANVGVALTELFPTITLTAKYGAQSNEFKELLQNPYSYLAGELLAPVFAMGGHRANVRAQKAAFEQAYYTYEKVVISAFSETNTAINNFYKAKEIRKLIAELVESSQNYLDLANLQYINGIINYMDVLDAQRKLFDAQVSLNNAYRDELISYIQLYKALGGGWQG